MLNVRKIIILLVLMLLFTLSGCQISVLNESDISTETPTLSNAEPVFEIPPYEQSEPLRQYDISEDPLENYYDPTGYDVSNYFLGELPQEVPVREVSLSVEGDRCIYNGRSYQKMTTASNSNAFPWSGWQLDCSYLEGLGKTESGEIVYGITYENTVLTILLLDDQNEQKLAQWFVLENLGGLDVHCLTIDDFYAQKVYGDEDTETTLSTIWSLHTDKSYEQAELWLLERPVCHMFFLISKNIPWLVYELDYCYVSEYSSTLFFYNANAGGVICLKSTEE